MKLYNVSFFLEIVKLLKSKEPFPNYSILDI